MPPPEDTHYRILRLLEHNPNLSQRELAQELGLSLGKANYCLKALIAKGLVKVENFRNKENKLAYAYILTPVGLTEKVKITRRFLARKMAEYDALKHEIERLKLEVEAQKEAKSAGAARRTPSSE